MELIKNNVAMVDTSGETSFKAQLEYAQGEVAALEKEYKDVVADASGKEAYKSCKATSNKLSKIATQLEKARKEIKAPVLKAGQLIDEGINPLTERMKALAAPFKEAVKEVDDRIKKQEAERQAKVDQVFASFSQAVINAAGKSSAEIEEIVDELAATSIDSATFGKQTDSAVKTLNETIQSLSVMAVSQQQAEEYAQKEAEFAKREAELKEKERQYMGMPPANDPKPAPNKVSLVTQFEPQQITGKALNIESLSDLAFVFTLEKLESLLGENGSQYAIEITLSRALPEAKAA